MSEHVFWEGTDPKGINARCTYNGDTAMFKVTVSKDSVSKSEEWHQNWTPTFGMDIVDSQIANETAERLAQAVEKELGI